MSDQLLSLMNEIGVLLSEQGERSPELIIHDISRVHEVLKQELLSDSIQAEAEDITEEEFNDFYSQLSEYLSDESTSSIKNLYSVDRIGRTGKQKKYVCRGLIKLVKSRGDTPLDCWLEGAV